MKSAFSSELRVGIALSGGGSRAIAYHLGCLRALHRSGLLERARIMSTVSGGSVIGAMYATRDGDFDAFERKVRETLAAGFLLPSLRTAVTTLEGLRALLVFAGHSLYWCYTMPLWLGGCLLGNIAKPNWPIRSASRTTILQRTFRDLLFGNRNLSDLSPRLPRLLMIAAELRTGSAFYFGRSVVGTWRLGRANPSKVSIAHAVTASAAYPLFLPAIDEEMDFEKTDGSLRCERVTLSDGGLYDNLALAPLWPGRSSEVSLDVDPVDFIVACRAGYGLRLEKPSLFFRSRMEAAFNCIHARAQNATMQRLFDLEKGGQIAGFVLSYLDQKDGALKCSPPNLVPRTSVVDYPTNFNAMSEDWIDRLSMRGDQITEAALREHAFCSADTEYLQTKI